MKEIVHGSFIRRLAFNVGASFVQGMNTLLRARDTGWSHVMTTSQCGAFFTVAVLSIGLITIAADFASAQEKLDRTALPIQAPKHRTITELDARDAKAPPRFEVKAPKDAPNVVIVLIDDIGFGTSGAFGGPLKTPTLDRLSKSGLRYNQFHTTALCSPTRVALLTGRNHHSANAGSVMEIATAFPGNNGVRPRSVEPVAEMLRLNGYSTAAFGKYHETAPWEVSISGPFDRWPTRSGFDKFYGFIGGETNQWAPFIHDGTTAVEPPDDPNYHFTTDMTNQAIKWMRFQQSLTPDKPFFIYFAPGATHAPHHVPKEYIAKYKGKFDAGWDKYREATLARQIELGVVPKGTKLARKPRDIKDWDELSTDERKLCARQMECFAAFTEHTDHEVGRLYDAIDDMGEADNTLFVYIFGDNGASAEGGLAGTWNEMIVMNGLADNFEDQLRRLDDFGGKDAYNHFHAGWAVACSTPFQWTKQVASHYGGTRNGMVMHWPKGIKAKGEIRSQWHHVNDIAPTVMEAAGLPFPKSVNGAVQKPFEGVSMVYSFDDADAPDRHTTQYFEMFGNRAIYNDGWVAAVKHTTPWRSAPDRPLAEDRWELYHVAKDFSQAVDVADKYPEKLKQLQELFISEATKYNVLPLDDRTYERFNAAIAGRPDLMGDRTSLTLYEGMDRIMENVFINVKNRSHTITAEIVIPEAGGEGVIICQGGKFAGWSLYMKGGKVSYVHNWFGRKHYTVTGKQAIPAGEATIRYEFAYAGGKEAGKGGKGTLLVNGKKVAEGLIGNTVPALFSGDETVDVGVDHHTPVTPDYQQRGNEFNGKIGKVKIELK
jgi:arylsulfatase